MSTRTCKAEHSRQWAQFLNDERQTKPAWFEELKAYAIDHNYSDEEIVEVAIDIIEDFPVNATDAEANSVYLDRAREESLHDQDKLIRWLCANKLRFDYLDESISSSDNLLDALRRAYAECIKLTISEIEVWVDEYPAPVYQLVLDDDDDEDTLEDLGEAEYEKEERYD